MYCLVADVFRVCRVASIAIATVSSGVACGDTPFSASSQAYSSGPMLTAAEDVSAEAGNQRIHLQSRLEITPGAGYIHVFGSKSEKDEVGCFLICLHDGIDPDEELIKRTLFASSDLGVAALLRFYVDGEVVATIELSKQNRAGAKPVITVDGKDLHCDMFPTLVLDLRECNPETREIQPPKNSTITVDNLHMTTKTASQLFNRHYTAISSGNLKLAEIPSKKPENEEFLKRIKSEIRRDEKLRSQEDEELWSHEVDE